MWDSSIIDERDLSWRSTIDCMHSFGAVLYIKRENTNSAPFIDQNGNIITIFITEQEGKLEDYFRD